MHSLRLPSASWLSHKISTSMSFRLNAAATHSLSSCIRVSGLFHVSHPLHTHPNMWSSVLSVSFFDHIVKEEKDIEEVRKMSQWVSACRTRVRTAVQSLRTYVKPGVIVLTPCPRTPGSKMRDRNKESHEASLGQLVFTHSSKKSKRLFSNKVKGDD